MPTTDGLTEEEIKIIKSTIDLRQAKVLDFMVKKENIFFLNNGDIIDEKLLKRVAKKNYSRIPVFNSDHVCVGILRSKQLLNFESVIGKSIKNSGINLIKPVIIKSNTNLLESLSILEQKKVSMLLITDEYSVDPYVQTRSRNDQIYKGSTGSISGLITLKEVFEKLVEKDFDDQEDHYQSLTPNNLQGNEFKKKKVS